MSFMDAFLAREKRLFGSTLRKESHFWYTAAVVTGASAMISGRTFAASTAHDPAMRSRLAPANRHPDRSSRAPIASARWRGAPTAVARVASRICEHSALLLTTVQNLRRWTRLDPSPNRHFPAHYCSEQL